MTMTREQEQIQIDRIAIMALLGDVSKTMVGFSADLPATHRRDFKRAYGKHARHYTREFDKLLSRSIQLRPTTHIGLTCAAILHRSISCFKNSLDTADMASIEEGNRLLKLLALLDASSQNVNEDLAQGLAQAGFFNAEVSEDGK